MSRVGKKPIDLPDGVDVKMDGFAIKVSKGDKTLVQDIHPNITVEIDNDAKQVSVKRPSDAKLYRSLHGLYRALINNMVIGVNEGFERKLEIVGVGYRAELKGRNLVLTVGYSHPILFKPPTGIEIIVPTPTSILIKGINKQVVGQVAAKIRSFRPPEPYKGKGIKYDNEKIRRKAGKAAG
ncbi:50S ribosomal protein L6 [candidate division KSB1 bacterium]|nr:50S ribosomal protein L6 [candidate division KSB1 bacterium]